MNKELRKATKIAQRQFVEAMRAFEKRSKFITITSANSFWGLYVMHIDIAKENKVTDEMLDYIKSLCDYREDDEYSIWFHSYDSYDIDVDEDEWTLKYQICVSKK